MFLKKKSRFKPLYKQFGNINENIQNRKKLLKFKKKKWEKLIQNYKRKLKWYKKFKPKDQTQFLVAQYPIRNFSYKKRHKNTLLEIKKFKLFYGGVSNKKLKKLIKITFSKKFKNSEFTFLNFFESRLDTVLYRAKFCLSIRAARQWIFHNKVFINKKFAKTKSYILKPGDLIALDFNFLKFAVKNVKYSETFFIPPKYLIINYKTMQITFFALKNTNYSLNFFYFKLEKIITSYYKH